MDEAQDCSTCEFSITSASGTHRTIGNRMCYLQRFKPSEANLAYTQLRGCVDLSPVLTAVSVRPENGALGEMEETED